jgi:hypothetical protein
MKEMFGKVHVIQQMEGTQFLPLATTASELYTDWGVIKSEDMPRTYSLNA